MIHAKYDKYIQKQREQIEKMHEMLEIRIPEDMDFGKIPGLSNEIREKLEKFRPPTLQAASQISGVTPAAIEILHIYIKMAEKGRR
jgi:tRNA uridine 5-carboxymethylaminomethyl modification enzyme